jgi:multidrug efflux system membrane fusion protein
MALQDHHSAPATGEHNKTSRSFWPWLLALALAAAVIFVLLREGEEAPQTRHGRFGPDDRPIPVVAAKVERRDVDIHLDALGTVTPRNTVVVKSRVDGELMKLHFREGDMVRAGDLLAQIDPRSFEAQLAEAEGALARDQALLDNALVDLDRYETLLRQDSIAKQQVDTQAALVNQYRGAIAVDRAQIETAKLQLAYSRITAPISGRVGLRQVDPGNIISSGDANGIVTITQMQPITVLFSIPEVNLPTVLERMKQQAPIPVEAYNRNETRKLASGTLLTVDNQIDTTTGTIRLRAQFENEEGTLFPNQFVNVRMLVDVERDAVTIPLPGLQRGRSGDYVYVVENGETVALRNVKSGQVSGETVVIEDGLAPGEVVVIDGADKLRDGAKVKPSFDGRPTAAGDAEAREGPGNAVAKTAAPNPEGASRPRGGQ